MKLQELFEAEERNMNDLKKLHPYLFRSNSRSINADQMGLTSLEGSPELIRANFEVQDNKLVTLKGGPERVEGSVFAHRNKLTSLEGSPKYIGKHFSISKNEIEDFAGAPEHIGGAVNFSNNKLRSLHNIHKHFKYIHEHIDLDGNPVISHVLGLLLIDGLEKVFMDNTDVQKIINKHLASGQDVFACQEELIEAGYEDYAQL